MPRRVRFASGGYAYHVLNRGVGRMRIFVKQRDFEAFEEVLQETKDWLPMRVLAWCVMPNHWHFVLWPREDGDLSEFMRWLTVLDTGVVVSAVLLPHSAPRQAFDLAVLRGPLLVSDQTIAELDEVLRRPKFDGYVSQGQPYRHGRFGPAGASSVSRDCDCGPTVVPGNRGRSGH